MWVMTSFGILMPSLRPSKTVPMGDNRTLQIRTRREQDLDILRDEYMGDELGATIATPDFDYNYRTYCTPEAWGRALYEMSLDIDFEKFKPTTFRYNDSELHSVYNSIWSTVCRLNDPWGAKDWEKSKSASSGNVLRDEWADRKVTPQAVRSPVSATDWEDKYRVVAGPPKGQRAKGYVWDRKPAEVHPDDSVWVDDELIPEFDSGVK